MAQVGGVDSNLANPASLKFGSQLDARQFALPSTLATLYQQQLQHMQLQAQQQQQHKDSDFNATTATAAEKQQRLVLLQHQQFLVQQRMMHAHIMQQTVTVNYTHRSIIYLSNIVFLMWVLGLSPQPP